MAGKQMEMLGSWGDARRDWKAAWVVEGLSLVGEDCGLTGCKAEVTVALGYICMHRTALVGAVETD